MTLQKTLQSAVMKRSRYQQHWLGQIRENTPSHSRQSARHVMRSTAYENAARLNWSRKERRQFARAKASAKWREIHEVKP